MKVGAVDLRYRMKSIIQALDRNETVTLLYHGKEKGLIVPYSSSKEKSISQHPFFGMSADDAADSVETDVDKLRSVCS